jgi:hypothetical protein
MTVTFDLPPQVEQAYREIAAAKGVPVDALVREVVIAGCSQAKQPEPTGAAFHQRFGHEPSSASRTRTPEEIRVWLDELASLSNKIPAMPGETFSREMIYQDHD